MPRFNKADLRHFEDLFMDHDYLSDDPDNNENSEEYEDGNAEREAGKDASSQNTKNP